LKNKLLSLKGTFSVRLFTSKPITLEIFNHDKMLLTLDSSTDKTFGIGIISKNAQVNDFNNNDDLLKNFKQTESIDTSTSLSSKNSKDSNDSSKDSNDSFLQRAVEYETNTFDMKVTDNIEEVNTVMNLVKNSSSPIDSELMICTLKYENTDNNYGYFVFTPSLDKLVLLHPKN
jgi:predicted P-loop ATPase